MPGEEMAKLGKIFASACGALNRMNQSLRWAGIGLIIGATLIMDYEVFMRYALNRPTIWALETTQVFQVFLPMLLCGWVLVEEGHVKIDIITARLNPRQENWLHCFSSVLAVIYCATFAWLGWGSFQVNLLMGGRTQGLGTPIAIMAMMLFLGFCLFTVSFIARIHKYYHLAKTEVKDLE